MQPITVEGEVDEGTDNDNVGLIFRIGSVRLVAADITDIDLQIFALGGTTALYTDAGILATDTNTDGGVVFSDALRVDGHWGLDVIGYNFRHSLLQSDLVAASVALEGGKNYLLEYLFNSATFGTIKARFIHRVKASGAS